MRAGGLAHRADLVRDEAQGADDVRHERGATVHVGLGPRRVLDGDHRHPCLSGPSRSGQVPRGLARKGRQQRERWNAERAREVVDAGEHRDDADQLHILRDGEPAGDDALEPGAGQSSGIGADPMDDVDHRERPPAPVLTLNGAGDTAVLRAPQRVQPTAWRASAAIAMRWWPSHHVPGLAMCRQRAPCAARISARTSKGP